MLITYLFSSGNYIHREGDGELKLVSLWVEFRCPEHGLERYRIKIVKRFNMDPDTMVPKYRTRPKPGEIKFLAVGRNVSHQEIERYFIDYFRERGVLPLRMRLTL
jgi:hypothetical protein